MTPVVEQLVQAAFEWLHGARDREWYATFNAALSRCASDDDVQLYAFEHATEVHGFAPKSYKGERP